jgi:effector-associated domain 1 (EAD1)-containing protein
MSVMAAGAASGDDGGGELNLNSPDRRMLEAALASIYNEEDRIRTLLREVDFPRELIPTWREGSSARDYWRLIFEELERGVMPAPYRSLLEVALRVYASHPRLAELQRRYLAEEQPAQPPVTGTQQPGTQQPGAQQAPRLQAGAQPDSCHVVVWLRSKEREALEAWMADHGLDPQAEWITATSASYRVNQSDPQAVDRVMSGRPDANWTVVAPGTPDYVLRYLSVQGPDGRSFRFSDVPSATPVGSVASELVGQYTEGQGLPGGDQPTVVEHVEPAGPRRMNPDSTLAEEGVTEGARLRVGFERRAAAVNPLDRRDALFRVRNQLLEYAETHPGFIVRPNSPALPTEYDLEFSQPSFGPPEIRGEEPPEISAHQLSIVLPPDFPIVAPRVRWTSKIFHPNVYPTYESDKLRANPYAHGLVCLGTLAESYQPSLEFGELCATLVDIAGYRNYSVFVPSDDAVDERTGQPLLRGDYYDEAAARWAYTPLGQERILGIGGASVFKALFGRPAGLGLEVEIEPDEIEQDEIEQYEIEQEATEPGEIEQDA